jgi:hypothetical protein
VLLALDGERIGEAAVGGVLVLALLALALVQWRLAHARRRESIEPPGIPALARSGPVVLTDPLGFGGGAPAAELRRRRDTVAYGHLAVVEQFSTPDGAEQWCTLTVNLPGRVPFLSVDRAGTHGPAGSTRVTIGEDDFDPAFTVWAAESRTAGEVLVPAARRVLLEATVQRVMLRGSHLLLRTPNGASLGPVTTTDLVQTASAFLASTPSFITHDLAGRPLVTARQAAPLPPGLYGVDEADETSASSALS